MNQVICPLDNQPCEQDCPDRYQDQPEGGCFLTTAQELGTTVLALASTGLLDKKEALASAANAGEGKAVTRWHDVSASTITENGGFVK